MIDFRIGNNHELIKELGDETVSISIFSPPYKNSDNFQEIDFHHLFSELYRVQKKNSLMFMNFGHLQEDKLRPFKVALKAEEAGWKTKETFIWLKTQYKPIQGKKCVNNLTEFIFMFYKKSMPDLDRLAIGVEYSDKNNIKRGYSDVDLRCGGNLWKIPYKTIQRKDQKPHFDVFPLQLPLNCLKLSGLKEGVCLDVFAGSGTTGVAAAKLGLDFIGFEKNPIYKKVFEERMKNGI